MNKKYNGQCAVFKKYIYIYLFSSPLTGQASRQVAVRHASSGASREFHAKYGMPLLIAGATFCTAVWSYVGIHVVATLHPNYAFPRCRSFSLPYIFCCM